MPMADSRIPKQSTLVNIATIGLVCAFTIVQAASAPSADDESQIAGNWSGESICQVKNSPCHDEKVIYHLTKSKEPGKVTATADKIVDGRPVNMGAIDFTYDKDNGMLISDSNRGVWKFIVRGKTMEGTLTLPDKTLYRRVSLRKQDN